MRGTDGTYESNWKVIQMRKFDDQVEELLKQYPGMTVQQLVGLTKCSAQRANSSLHRLANRGIAERTENRAKVLGKSRKGAAHKWYLKGKAPAKEHYVEQAVENHRILDAAMHVLVRGNGGGNYGRGKDTGGDTPLESRSERALEKQAAILWEVGRHTFVGGGSLVYRGGVRERKGAGESANTLSERMERC